MPGWVEASYQQVDRLAALPDTQKASQEPVFAFLSDPATHGGKPVKRIDTHAASVFLAGERALKVKRAVRFPFLDYSTLEQRKAACEMELTVNRPFAPEIYRRIVAVTRTPDGHSGAGWRRRAGRVGGRDAALRRRGDARPFGGRRTDRCGTSPIRWVGPLRPRMRPPRRSTPSPGSPRSATISNRTMRHFARCRRCFRRTNSTP